MLLRAVQCRSCKAQPLLWGGLVEKGSGKGLMVHPEPSERHKAIAKLPRTPVGCVNAASMPG